MLMQQAEKNIYKKQSLHFTRKRTLIMTLENNFKTYRHLLKTTSRFNTRESIFKFKIQIKQKTFKYSQNYLIKLESV